jgi:putative glutamine amidotransferase
MTPLIGITTSLAPAGSNRLPHAMLGAQYIEAVERAGAAALLLTPAHAPGSLDLLLDRIDGLVLSGGEDIDPTLYEQAPHPALDSVNPARDAMEVHVLAGALRRRLPVLAICRGMQLLNVAWSGTLFQDLPSLRAGPVEHRQRAAIDRPWHRIAVEPGSLLADVTGGTGLVVNSFHHQGIDRLAPGLRTVARADDGLIEAVEAVDEQRWVVGVQWHPERSEAEGGQRPNASLFERLAAEAGNRASRA